MTAVRPAALLLIVAGFMVWASAFVLLYAAASLGCASGWDRMAMAGISLQRALLLAIWALHVTVAALVLLWCWRFRAASDADGLAAFISRIAIGSSIAALAATLWTGLMIPVLTMCV